MTKVAKRQKFNSTKFKRRYYRKITKKVNAKFARRPKLTLKMFMCAFDDAKVIAPEFEKVSPEAYRELKIESEREEMRKPDEQKEEEVCKRLEAINLDVCEKSSGGYDMWSEIQGKEEEC